MASPLLFRYHVIYTMSSSSNPETDNTSPTNNTEILSKSDRFIAAIGYLGFLSLVARHFALKRQAFVQKHVKQGMALFIIECVLFVIDVVVFYSVMNAKQFSGEMGILAAGYYFLMFQAPFVLIALVIVLLSIIGIVKAALGKSVESPIIGRPYR